jgi:hypothetical protein
MEDFMKIIFNMILILVALGCIYADDTTATATSNKIARKESIKVCKGIILSASNTTHTIIVRTWKAEDTLVINSETNFSTGSRARIFSDLQVDAAVTAYYKLEGNAKVVITIVEKNLVNSQSTPEN